MKGLSGKIVAVTGASGGIGSAICRRLLDEGAAVYALDLSAPETGEFVRADVTDDASMRAAADTVVQRAGRVDGLVAGAGIVEDDVAAEEMPVEQFDKVLAVNLRGVFLACQAFGRKMLDQGQGRIVTISSMSGNRVVNTPQKQCAYNASKAGVTALTKSLAVEWAPRGVRVNAISPGYVDTALLSLKRHQFDQWLGRTPTGRFARPEEIAGTIAFLLSDEAAFFCGSEVVVDGGYTLV